MAYNIKLSELAALDLSEIFQYKSQFYQRTTRRFSDKFERVVSNLEKNPRMYAKYAPDPAFRKANIDEYLMFYKISSEEKMVNIYRILHGMRDVSKLL